MIPYFRQPTLSLGPVTLHAFGGLVAAAVIVGSELAARRCRKLRLDPAVCLDLSLYAVVAGFVGAHLYSVLAYYPREAAQNPLMLLKVWENISSFGGFAGGLAGIWLFFRGKKGRGIDRLARVAYLDAVAFVMPFAWAIGRLACTTAHDHPGTVTSFPLAVSLSSFEARAFITSVYREAGRLAELPPPGTLSRLGFHDLGWYEFLYTALVMVPAFLLLDRKKARPPGFYLAAFVLLYAPVRFVLDFLRLADARYVGLTPGQYAAAAFFGGAVFVMRKKVGASDRV